MSARIMRTAIALALSYLFGVYVAQDWQWFMARESIIGDGGIIDRYIFASVFTFVGLIAWFFDEYKDFDFTE